MTAKLYLSGPEALAPQGETAAAAKRARVAARGAMALNPLDTVLEADPEHHPRPLVARAIFDANRALLDEADAVLANLTPLRGASADPGVIFEIGYASARGTPVFGYSNDPRPFAERVAAEGAGAGAIEDFDLPSDTLMAHFALTAYFTAPAASEARWSDLASFEAALEAALAFLRAR